MKKRKLDNKGFAITGILYTLFVLFLLIMMSVLAGLNSRKNSLEKSVMSLEESFSGNNAKSSEYITYVSENQIAPVTGKYVFEFEGSKNLLYGLEDIGTTSSGKMNYSVSNGVVTVTSTNSDGYGFTNGRVNLESGKNYIFSATTNGTWGGNDADTVEAFLMLDGAYNTWYHMATNVNYSFTPAITGTYWLRLDVNQSEKTYTFSNIKIIENVEKNTCISYLNKGDSIEKSNVTFIPDDCNDYDYVFSFGTDDSSSYKITLKEVYSFESE